MSNTIIQIKRSSVSAAPPSLNPSELAYSYVSNKLFIGDAGGNVVEIGGAYYANIGVAAYINSNAAFDKANSANLFTYNLSIAANSYAEQIGAAANAYTRAFANSVGTSANAYAVVVGTSSNAFATLIGTSGNSYAQQVGTSGNSYAALAGTSANAYADGTFVKLTNGNQTITGNLAITGSITIAGNAFSVDTETLRVSDPLIYLAGNNYSSDIVDIGFVANYVNATGSNVHTGLFRDATVKEYYLFQGYDKEPNPNHIDTTGNNFTLAVLNADVKTSNLTLGGSNAMLWIGQVYDKANAANLLAYNVSVSANSYADQVGSAANAYSRVFANSVGTSANAYAVVIGTSANVRANLVGDSANAYSRVFANSVGTSANAYAVVVGAAANTNAANATYLSTGTVPSGRVSGSYTGITGVGTLTAGTWNADTITVPYGGTGVTSFTTNGILYGNNSGSLKVTAAGTEGQVLQASATGVPQFAHLDGGAF